MSGWLVKSGRGWLPADDEAQKLHARMGAGECAQFSIVQPRSVPWHRMYFGLCRTIGENQDPPRDEDSIDMELRILAGHFDVMYVGAHEVRVPKRIAFDKMTAEAWEEYWKRAEQAIIVRFGPEYIQGIAA